MKLLLAISLVFLTGCANHNLLIRCEQLEGQRDQAIEVAVKAKQQNDHLMQLLLELYTKYKEFKPRDI